MRSFTAPDRQMVVVPATSTSATTEMAKVSFTVLPLEKTGENGARWMSGNGQLGLTSVPDA
ncbi:hypothetical protein WT20_05160 [Burkholderia stagnalis]|nr:hypothetical protein WT20_05160 [Burkholderia stagnalis]KWN72310.1 hypothetical protein WT90_18625 [Burkholderia stagnalis]